MSSKISWFVVECDSLHLLRSPILLVKTSFLSFAHCMSAADVMTGQLAQELPFGERRPTSLTYAEKANAQNANTPIA